MCTTVCRFVYDRIYKVVTGYISLGKKKMGTVVVVHVLLQAGQGSPEMRRSVLLLFEVLGYLRNLCLDCNGMVYMSCQC